jgi:hypothetical protein
MELSELLSQFSMNRLDGETVPDDLGILLAHREELAGRTDIELELGDRWSPLSDGRGPGEPALGDPNAVAEHRARAEVCRLCAFVAHDRERNSLGYWRGKEKREIAGSPVVVLDDNGQFHLCAAQTFAEAVLERAYGRPEFAELREWLRSIGIAIGWESPAQLTFPHEKLPPKELHRQLAEQYRRSLHFR